MSSQGTFLLRDGRAGHYEVRLGDDRYITHLFNHEPTHSGHQGSFASGYSYFICGSRGGPISQTVLRGELNGTCLVVSRSYSADCQDVSQAAFMDEVSHAFASDIDTAEVGCAKMIAELYGAPRSKMSFKTFKTPEDAIICSPPGGGPAYLAGVYDVGSMDPNFERILQHCATFTDNHAMLMPRNVAIDQMAQTAGVACSDRGVELELSFLAGKIKTSTVYYGEAVNKAQ